MQIAQSTFPPIRIFLSVKNNDKNVNSFLQCPNTLFEQDIYSLIR